jgi:hypothetical protein
MGIVVIERKNDHYSRRRVIYPAQISVVEVAGCSTVLQKSPHSVCPSEYKSLTSYCRKQVRSIHFLELFPPKSCLFMELKVRTILSILQSDPFALSIASSYGFYGSVLS